VIFAVIAPLLVARGAGLGRTLAVPMVRVVTVLRELNPSPVITITSSTEPEDGLMVIDGLGTLKKVEVPVVLPMVTVTIL
jgi:hypothetical protein